MESKAVEEGTWLDKVHDIITWHVVAPRIHTAFGEGVPTPLLRKYVDNIDVLKRHVGLRGMVDGHEFMFITNLKSLNFFSDHFIVSALSKRQVDAYLTGSGVLEWVDEELMALQKDYAEELSRRSQERPTETQRASETMKQKRDREKSEKQAVQKGAFNRFYSGGTRQDDS